MSFISSSAIIAFLVRNGRTHFSSDCPEKGEPSIKTKSNFMVCSFAISSIALVLYCLETLTHSSYQERINYKEFIFRFVGVVL